MIDNDMLCNRWAFYVLIGSTKILLMKPLSFLFLSVEHL